MPTFVFISGVFGASLARRSLAMMLCYCLGTSMLVIGLDITLWRLIIFASGAGGHSKSSALMFEKDVNLFWFLLALGIWRLTVTPLTAAVRKARLPRVVA